MLKVASDQSSPLIISSSLAVRKSFIFVLQSSESEPEAGEVRSEKHSSKKRKRKTRDDEEAGGDKGAHEFVEVGIYV